MINDKTGFYVCKTMYCQVLVNYVEFLFQTCNFDFDNPTLNTKY